MPDKEDNYSECPYETNSDTSKGVPKKILILNTGGTLSCLPVQTCEGLTPQKGLVQHLFDKLFASERNSVNITDSSTFIDSSDATPDSWNSIIREVLERFDAKERDQYSGVIVIHGTDTLAYTASALSFYLNNTVPIIITGSQFPFARWTSSKLQVSQSEKKENVFLDTVEIYKDKEEQNLIELNGTTDAFPNLYGSIEMMKEMIKEKACGVFVFFNNKLMKGTRVRKVHTDNIDAFESVNCLPVGKVNVDSVVLKLDLMHSLSKPKEFILRNATQVEKAIQARFAEKKSSWDDTSNDKGENLLENTIYYEKGPVEMLRVHPGINESLFEGKKVTSNFDQKKICILLTYGAGNLPGNVNKKVKENKETTYLSCSECYNGKGSQDYSTSCVNENCVSLFDMTPETALVKAHYVRQNFKSLKQEWIENRHIFSLFSETLRRLLFLNDHVVKFATQYLNKRKESKDRIQSIERDTLILKLKEILNVYFDKCPSNDPEVLKVWATSPQKIRQETVDNLYRNSDELGFDNLYQNFTNDQLKKLAKGLKGSGQNCSYDINFISEGMKEWGCPMIIEFLEKLEEFSSFEQDLEERKVKFSDYVLPEVLKGIFSFEEVKTDLDVEKSKLLKLDDLKLFQIIMRYSFNGEVINHDSRKSKDAFNKL